MSSTVDNLAEQQNQLLAQLCAKQLTKPSRGMQAYRANAHASAERALLAAYPVMQQLLGADSFAQLARALWHAHPPERGDLAQWGQALASYVAGSPQLLGTPYLPDVARLEWALHTCATAADSALDATSFNLLTQHDPSALHLHLAPGTQLLASSYPVVTLLQAHTGQAALGDAAKLLRQGQPQTALVWREGLVPRMRPVQADERDLLQALVAGQTLGQALEVMSPSLDFSAWLAAQVQSGLLLGAQHITR
jgi:Putative DNA-binding domain